MAMVTLRVADANHVVWVETAGGPQKLSEWIRANCDAAAGLTANRAAAAPVDSHVPVDAPPSRPAGKSTKPRRDTTTRERTAGVGDGAPSGKPGKTPSRRGRDTCTQPNKHNEAGFCRWCP